MKVTQLKLASLCLLASALALNAFAGGPQGQGGGGVVKNGRYMTFYTAGLYTEPTAANGSDQVPGIDALLGFVQSFKYWTAAQKSALLQWVVPSAAHQYFKVLADKFDKTTQDRLVAEFSRVTGEPTDAIDLYAVTDTNAHITYLLPDFYKLSATDQVAILFHENFWLMNPRTDYQTVISAEMAFEATFTEPTNLARTADLLGYYGDANYGLKVSIDSDIASGAIKGLIASDGTIPLLNLFGKDFLTCQGDGCVPGMAGINIFHLTEQYPQSILLKRIWERAQPGAGWPAALIYTQARYYPATVRLSELKGWFFTGLKTGTETKSQCLNWIFDCNDYQVDTSEDTSLSDCSLQLNLSSTNKSIPIVCKNGAVLGLILNGGSEY